MRDKQRREIIKHHNELFNKFGLNHASMGWPKGRTDLRFNVMSQIGNLNNSKILDVGCGFGYFLAYLKKRKKKIQYTGIDINSDFIKLAKKKYPNHIFKVRDIEKEKVKEKFDWVFAIGLGSKACSYMYIENLLKEMVKISKKGVVMDFITDYVDFKNKGTFYASPEKIFKMPYVCLPRIKLDGNVTIGLSKFIASREVLKPDQSRLSRIISDLQIKLK